MLQLEMGEVVEARSVWVPGSVVCSVAFVEVREEASISLVVRVEFVVLEAVENCKYPMSVVEVDIVARWYFEVEEEVVVDMDYRHVPL